MRKGEQFKDETTFEPPRWQGGRQRWMGPLKEGVDKLGAAYQEAITGFDSRAWLEVGGLYNRPTLTLPSKDWNLESCPCSVVLSSPA